MIITLNILLSGNNFMSRVKPYNFEKYSIFDIQDYLHTHGYQTEIISPLSGDEMHVIGTDVSIDLPLLGDSRSVLNNVFAEIRFEDYPRTEQYEKSKKLYELLKRKFAEKKGERAKTIKDRDRIEKLWKRNKELMST